MGSEADYTRIDRALYRPPRFPKDFHNHHSRMHGFPGCRGPGYRLLKAKLDSRFIQDVTVIDGTPMAPLTPFTKIWRMRNNGTVEWPAGTQLMWIGGDRFSDRVSVLLEISQNGLPVSSEIDIAIDFRAPLRPGRYISYWRMASPFGQKFGQRVWVLIQVDESRPNSAGGTAPQELNLNLPPESGRQMVPSVAVVDPSLGMVELMKPNVDLLNQAAALAALPRGSHGGFPPPWNYSALPVAAATTVPPPGGAMPGETSTGDNSIEQALLKELEEMGFKQIEVNREVLRSNEYDLEQSVNQLCGISEWDPILEELQEMGFHDKEKNKKLLVKNGGSIKRVVLDLIAGEKE
ncbi:unnamed protein product [Spirodela intermedia]|uniref:Uncharacterized protein n=1 Tax=Spirodela intermedia TaxID=51605 RepID=A0A7I8JF26_SPIIN|nr:unnamed protein product [Spirodela intermedia]CAA6668002.1 unnamed protein product [Spirodela intermedia]